MTNRAWLLAGAVMVGAAPMAAVAQNANVYAVQLPAQPLEESLLEVSRLTGIQLVFTDAGLRNLRAPALNGRFTPDQLFARLLAGSGYVYRFTNANTVRVLRAEESTADMSMSAVAPPSSAGDLPRAEGPQEVAQSLVVTGSRIRRGTIDTPTPVVTIGGEELQETGDTELGEALAELPALSSTLND